MTSYNRPDWCIQNITSRIVGCLHFIFWDIFSLICLSESESESEFFIVIVQKYNEIEIAALVCSTKQQDKKVQRQVFKKHNEEMKSKKI